MTPSSPSTHPGSPATSAWRREVREPDAAQIIATFADVERDHWAPVTDEAIGRCVGREWGPLEVRLVPFGYAPLREFDCSTMAEALNDARRGAVFLLALSSAEQGGLFAVMTVPRPREPWFSLKMTEEKWYTRGDRPPYEFGIDWNAGCELRFLCVQFLIRHQTEIIARPRPRMALDRLESDYAAIRAAADGPLMIGDVDVSTWARFLERARRAAHTFEPRRGSDEADNSAQHRVLELAMQAWPAEAGEQGSNHRN